MDGHAYLVCPFLERVRSFGIQKLQHGHTNLLQEQDSNLGRRGGKQLPATWTIALLASAYLSHLIILNIIWKAEKRSMYSSASASSFSDSIRRLCFLFSLPETIVPYELMQKPDKAGLYANPMVHGDLAKSLIYNYKAPSR